MTAGVEAISFVKVLEDCAVQSRIWCFFVIYNIHIVMETFHWSDLIMYKSTKKPT